MPDRPQTPALVLGGPVHTALGVIRALGQKRIPQFAVGTRSSYVSYSRWHQRLPVQDGKDPTPESLASSLERLPFERMVLIPCSDDWVEAVARLGPSIATRFPASIAPPDSIDICLDKGRFLETLVQLGLPHPRTIRIDAPDDIAARWDSTLNDPFLKPRYSHGFRTRYGLKGISIRTPAEGAIWAREAQQAGFDLVLQEFIPGPASAHFYVDGFVDSRGAVCAKFARRRIRTYPEPFGDSSCMVSIPLEEAAEPLRMLERLLPALRYRGVFSAEFKRDDRDGRFKFIELNSRVWGGVSLPVSCGVDVVEMAYRDALGMPVEPIDQYPCGRHWVFGSRDSAVCWRLLREKRLTARDWIRTWAKAVQPIVRWDDPVPAIVDVLSHLRRARSAIA